MKNVVYRWYLSADGGTTKQRVYPIYKGELSKDYEVESGMQFYREKLSGKIDFVNEDYDWIMAQDLASVKIEVYLQVSFDNLSTTQLYWHGNFALTDMEVNADDKRIVVQPQVNDRYTKVMDGMEREYDLIRDLVPRRSIVNLVKLPYMQVIVEKGLKKSYLANNFVDNIRGNIVFQEDCIEDYYGTGIYKFGVIGYPMAFILTPTTDRNGQLPAIDAGGTYVGDYNLRDPSNGEASLYRDGIEENIYYIRYTYEFDINDYFKQTIQLVNGFTDEVLYSAEFWETNQTTLPMWRWQREFTMDAANSSMKGRFVVSTQAWLVSGRIMTDTDAERVSIDGVSVDVVQRPLQDVVAYSLNYKRVVQISNDYRTWVEISGKTSSEYIEGKTIYGKNSNGEYWLPPNELSDYVPIAQASWQGKVSFWSYPMGDYEDMEKKYSLNDAYHIADVISSLLQKIDPKITHRETESYSKFLYGPNPISETNERLLLTPKSNVLNSEYSQAAQKGTITLKMVLDMLAKVYQCYWWIDSENRLRIEHISYLVQGKSYTTGSTESVGTDLTTILNRRNEKAWDYNKNTWTYEKADIPERITFTWMDEDVRSIFKGQPIVLNSPFVERAKKEEQSISNFTTDIDMILIHPDKFSKDGYALLTGTRNYGQFIGRTIIFTTTVEDIIQAGEAGEEVTIVVMAKNASGQPQPIEYGFRSFDVYYKMGDLASLDTFVENTISFIAPHKEFTLYFRSVNGISCTIEIESITGANNIYDGNIEKPHRYKVQNYHLALEWLLPMFWKYNLPTRDASFNGQAPVTTTLVQKNRTQQVKLPIGPNPDPDAELLVRTSVGDGNIRKMSIPLSSRVATITLRQDTI